MYKVTRSDGRVVNIVCDDMELKENRVLRFYNVPSALFTETVRYFNKDAWVDVEVVDDE